MAQEPNRTDRYKTFETDLIDQTQVQITEVEKVVQTQKEQKKMVDFELKVPEAVEEVETWADRTCVSKRSLNRFLATLTPVQLAQAEVIVDDNSYIVFYPVLTSTTSNGAHFDEGLSPDGPPPITAKPIAEIEPICQETLATKAASSSLNNLNQDEWDKALVILLSSVKLI